MENQDDLPPSLTMRRESQDIPNLAMKKGNQGNLRGHPQFPRFHQEIAGLIQGLLTTIVP